MTTKYKTRAFVFKNNDINESDRNFSVFTDDFGRLDIFAKAIRKTTSKLRSGIDIFSISEIEFIQGRNRKTLTDAIIVEKFNNTSNDLEKFGIANKIGRILDDFIKGEEKDQLLFDLLNEVFRELNDGNFKTGRYEMIYCYFLWNALSLLGYRSEVQTCASCYEKLMPDNVYFSGEEGGIVCKKCSAKDKFTKKINSDIVKILRIILAKDRQMLSKLRIESSTQTLLSEVSESAIRAFCPAYN